MNSHMIIETIGYIGSALVLVSMLMTSVVRLRIINLIGSIIFAGYAIAIASYPTALMNIALAGINIYHIVKLCNEQRSYKLISISQDDGYFSYLLDKNVEDIRYWFPEYSPKDIKADVAYLVLCESDPACLFLGTQTTPGNIEVQLDYATPAYRDTSVGRYLYTKLSKEGYDFLTFRQKAVNHIPYLKKTGYTETEDHAYVLDLSSLR